MITKLPTVKLSFQLQLGLLFVSDCMRSYNHSSPCVNYVFSNLEYCEGGYLNISLY